MKEQPIPFSAPMVRALLDGRKTQTRRLVTGDMKRVVEERMAGIPFEPIVSRYGVLGDRLWVREAFVVGVGFDALSPGELPRPSEAPIRLHYLADGPPPDGAGRYRHARFMPRWASRITLEVTEVRVQRLHDISEEDARAEGVTPLESFPHRPYGAAFFQLWQDINGVDTAHANPWVWAVSFKRIEATP